MSEKLKPCPFCGGKAECLNEQEQNKGEWSFVRYTNPKCLCAMGYFESRNEAIAAWNTRWAGGKDE